MSAELPVPEDNTVYKLQSYWDDRFTAEAEYDWLVTFSQVEHILREHVRPTDRILVVGCGNSTFSRDLWTAGFKQLVNTDYSGVVIERMQRKHEDMEWQVMDMRDLQYEPESFDAVIDKAALDAVVCDEGDVWDPKAEVRRDVDQVCRSVLRVLKPGGTYVQISFQQPHFRRKYLAKEEYAWDVSVINIECGLGYFAYVMKKR